MVVLKMVRFKQGNTFRVILFFLSNILLVSENVLYLDIQTKNTMKTIWILSGVIGVLLLTIFLMYTSIKDAEKKVDRAEAVIMYMENRFKDDSLLRVMELETYKSNEKIIRWKKEIIRDTVYMWVDDVTKIRLFTELTNKR